MVGNESLYISEHIRISIPDSIFLMPGILDLRRRRLIADEDERDDEKALDPFNELVSPV